MEAIANKTCFFGFIMIPHLEKEVVASRPRQMPPAKAALATLELPRIEGTIKVKMVSDRRVLRPKATLDTPEYSASVWLSRDALHQHAEDILAAFEDVREDDLTTEFKAALLNAGTLAVFHVLIRVPLSVQSCFALQVLQQRGVLQLLLARLLP